MANYCLSIRLQVSKSSDAEARVLTYDNLYYLTEPNSCVIYDSLNGMKPDALVIGDDKTYGWEYTDFSQGGRQIHLSYERPYYPVSGEIKKAQILYVVKSGCTSNVPWKDWTPTPEPGGYNLEPETGNGTILEPHDESNVSQEDEKYWMTCKLYNTQGACVGELKFQSGLGMTIGRDSPLFSDWGGGYYERTNFDVTPLRFDSDYNGYYKIVLNELKPNGWEKWDNYATITVFDSENPFLTKSPDYDTLNLPSIYKPFYLKGFIRINESDGINACFNVYNGIGYMTQKEDSNYNSEYPYYVGKFKINIKQNNNTKLNQEIDIRREKPTMLCNYNESYNEITGLTAIGVTSLQNINISYEITESKPSAAAYAGFSTKSISNTETISFYKITNNYTYKTSGQTVTVTINKNTFNGDTSPDVKYFFVSPNLYNNLVSSNYGCNTEETYELNPHLRDVSGKKLSLYGATVCVDNKSDYTNITDNYAAILIQDVKPDAQVEYILSKHNNDPWAIIGITDPLVNLLSEDNGTTKFNEELSKGNVLKPHTNFVTIMTYKQLQERE